jgi:hypothetical protein
MPLNIRDGNGNTQNVGTLADVSGNLVPIHSNDSLVPTYRAAGVFTPYATGPLVLFQIKGSATKIVRVKRVGVAPTTATAAASISGYLQRTSTAGTGGTAATPTIAKLDTAHADATAVVTHYTTAAQAVGTTTGMGGPLSQFVVGIPIVSVPTVSILNQMQMLFPEVGAPIGQAIVLRGTSEFLNVINTTPANFANAVSLSYVIEWEEYTA